MMYVYIYIRDDDDDDDDPSTLHKRMTWLRHTAASVIHVCDAACLWMMSGSLPVDKR